MYHSSICVVTKPYLWWCSVGVLPEVAWSEEALLGNTISALVRPFDRKLATWSTFPRFFLSSSTTCWLGVFSTTSASYNLIIFYELALLLVICPFPAILFSYIIVYIYIYIYICCVLLLECPSPIAFYELALLLVI
jgi:hypothetical protein